MLIDILYVDIFYVDVHIHLIPNTATQEALKLIWPLKLRELARMIDKKTAIRLFSYDPHSGQLFWNVRPQEDFPSEWSWKVWNKRFSGKPAGWDNDQGYKMIKLFGRPVPAHRVIWLIQKGFPPSTIDHINGNRSDNRIGNLREVTVAENNRNAKLRKDNKSGQVGVNWHSGKGKWHAQICVDGKDIFLGLFDRLSDAICARRAAQNKYGFHQNHGRAA